MNRKLFIALATCCQALASCRTAPSAPPAGAAPAIVNQGNPLFRDLYTADPAPLVVGDTLYLYVGHDEARGEEMFNITEWLAYSTKDMQHWTAHGPIMKPTDFSWVQKDAWASQVHEKDGRFWFYTAVEHDPATSHGKAIGVAVADNPLGPFRDARGSALVKNEDTDGPHHWDDIDPTVWTEEDGTSWLIWGNAICKIAKLKPNMIEFDGPIHTIDLDLQARRHLLPGLRLDGQSDQPGRADILRHRAKHRRAVDLARRAHGLCPEQLHDPPGYHRVQG